jgi:hypothetical protein
VAGYREFQTGEVLTAANVNDFLMNQAVMVFADDAARTTALGAVITEGMLTYNLDTKALEVYDGTAWGPVVTAKEKRIAAFTGSGTWTVPAGVTYAIAHMMGGGGGSGATNTGGNGGDSTVAFAGGTVTGKGLSKVIMSGTNVASEAGAANTGQNAQSRGEIIISGGRVDYTYGGAPTNVFVVAAAAVTPAASISVTVGAGGSAGTGGAAGGSGYVYIEYYEEV